MNFLHAVGCDSYALNAKAFPSNLEPKLFDVWSSYIGTQVAFELFNMSKDPRIGMDYAVRGFISFASAKFSKVFIKPVSVDLYKTSVKSAAQLYSKEVNDLKRFLMNKGFNHWFKLSDIKVKVEGSVNKAANVFVAQNVQVFFALIPKEIRKPADSSKLTPILYQNARQLFVDGRVPKVLHKSDSLSKKLETSNHDSYPRWDVLLSSEKDWTVLRKELNLNASRAKGDVLALRLDLDPADPVYLCKNTSESAIRALRNEIDNMFLGVMR